MGSVYILSHGIWQFPISIIRKPYKRQLQILGSCRRILLLPLWEGNMMAGWSISWRKLRVNGLWGEYSPASSGTNTRAPRINKLEEGIPSSEPEGPQPITHRPTGFKVPSTSITVVSNQLVVPYNLFHPGRPISVRIRQYYRTGHSTRNSRRIQFGR